MNRPVGGGAVADGDLVVVYEGYDSMKAVYLDASKGQFCNRHGNFPHKDWVGKKFGSKVWSLDGYGFVHLLAPTPELWTQVLKHRTQILYAGDIGLICSHLDLRPGSVVLESGTGSGSLSTSLSRVVGPKGAVKTFEFHEERAQIAAEEFVKNGLTNVQVEHRNIEELGFPEDCHGKADAVFLDLPGPYKVVKSAALCLKLDGCFCSFSPCIEQVQRTCEELSEYGFRDIKTVEILLRYYRVTAQPLVTDLDSFDALKCGLSVPFAKKQPGQGRGQKRPAPDTQEVNVEDRVQDEQAGFKVEKECNFGANEQAGVTVDEKEGNAGVGGAVTQDAPPPAETLSVCCPEEDARGHTGYLTFARARVPPADPAAASS